MLHFVFSKIHVVAVSLRHLFRGGEAPPGTSQGPVAAINSASSAMASNKKDMEDMEDMEEKGNHMELA